MCQSCGSLQNATRYIELRHLPPVLYLQLLRFDNQNGRSRKINSFLEFPDKLDMKMFINESTFSNTNNSDLKYTLHGVVVHQGRGTQSGHYITFIRKGNEWFKFNDEKVEKVKDFDLDTDLNEDIIEIDNKNGDISKPKDGFHKSKDAYMLLYKLESSEMLQELPDSYEECNLPSYVSKKIIEDNLNFLKEQELLETQSTSLRAREKHHRKNMKKLYSNIEVPIEAEDCDFVDKKWLNSLFSANIEDDVEPLNNESLLCPHKNLSSKANYKCISTASADFIYSLYYGGPRLTLKENLCTTCSGLHFASAKIKNKLDKDGRLIGSLLKYKNIPNDPHYWVGAVSFKIWKQIKLFMFNKEHGIEHEDDESIQDGKLHSTFFEFFSIFYFQR